MAGVLVTGGCGFIGRNLVAKLVEDGNIVRVLDPAEPDGLPPGVEHVRGSVTDPGAVDAAVNGVDCVYHLAGIPHFWTPKKGDLDLVNRGGTETVLEAARAHAVKRIVHCSTESILLPKRRAREAVDESASPAVEDMPGPYTRSKCLGEQAALRAAGNGLDVIVVNPTVPIGPGDRNMTPPAAMIALFLEGGSPFFLDCVLNLVDVRDLADGIALAGARGRSGERYILGGENMPLRKLLRILGAASGRPMPKRAVPAVLALAAGTVSEWIADRVTGKVPTATREGVRIALRSAPFDSTKGRRELGYAPRPVEGALTEAVAWLSARRQAESRKAG
jgi:dihydroflavonol-4-reductase